jgi:hypothetical protein
MVSDSTFVNHRLGLRKALFASRRHLLLAGFLAELRLLVPGEHFLLQIAQ